MQWSPIIRRPVAITLLIVALLVVAAAAWSRSPIADPLGGDAATLQVQTYYPGTSSDVVDATVTVPLEKQFKYLSDVRRVSAQSLIGRSIITIHFEPRVTLDVAREEARAAIDAARGLLPDDLQMPPILVVE